MDLKNFGHKKYDLEVIIMDRFTKHCEDDSIELNITDYGNPPYPMVTNNFVRRLAEYEDTGLTPHEIERMKARMPLRVEAVESPDKMSIFGVSVAKIIELTNAEKCGKVLVLPCKIGDPIYQTKYKCTCTAGHKYLHNTCDRPTECRICPAVKVERWIDVSTFSLCMLDRIGIDFFVTPEEAESALKNI
jgi:hypothetical protein